MKSLMELLRYYDGVSIGSFATTELDLPTKETSICIKDDSRHLDSALLYDADRLCKASLVSFLACNRLRAGGYHTWGNISLYYARFHVISALLRLVGIAVVGQRLLLRANEKEHSFILIKKNAPEAKVVSWQGGSHKAQWRMFVKFFQKWAVSEAPEVAAAILYEDPPFPNGIAKYELEILERNSMNYLQSNAGVFFPESDFSAMPKYRIGSARASGNWDCLRTDAHPFGDDDPAEAHFSHEMLTWDLLKFVITALVKIQGSSLLEQYIWLIDNLDADSDLRQHMRDDLELLS